MRSLLSKQEKKYTSSPVFNQTPMYGMSIGIFYFLQPDYRMKMIFFFLFCILITYSLFMSRSLNRPRQLYINIVRRLELIFYVYMRIFLYHHEFSIGHLFSCVFVVVFFFSIFDFEISFLLLLRIIIKRNPTTKKILMFPKLVY